jgi:hypothetical protein
MGEELGIKNVLARSDGSYEWQLQHAVIQCMETSECYEHGRFRRKPGNYSKAIDIVVMRRVTCRSSTSLVG